MDDYSCGAQSAFVVLKYYGKARSIKNVTRELGITCDGTDSGQLRRLFAGHDGTTGQWRSDLERRSLPVGLQDRCFCQECLTNHDLVPGIRLARIAGDAVVGPCG